MKGAEAVTDYPIERLSFAKTIKTVLNFSPVLNTARAGERFDLYINLIARHINPHRPGRIEPRLVKREVGEEVYKYGDVGCFCKIANGEGFENA